MVYVRGPRGVVDRCVIFHVEWPTSAPPYDKMDLANCRYPVGSVTTRLGFVGLDFDHIHE